MKRLFSMLAVAAVLAAMIGMHGVADEQEGHHRGKGKMGEMMQHEHPKQQMPMMHEMMRRMMQPEVVATADGGVVVRIGHTLLKYDEELTLVARAEIEIDEAEMKRMMHRMHQHHRARMKMMEGMH